MAVENAHRGGPLDPHVAADNARLNPDSRRRGRQPVALPVALESVHSAYTAQLATAPLSAETRRTYASKARQYLAWLEAADIDAAPLTDPAARDRAVRDWRTHLLTVGMQAPTTVNNALAAVDDFYTRRGMGRAAAERTDLPTTAPRVLDKRAQLRWLRAVEACLSARDRALAGTLFYAGARIAEAVRLETDDVRTFARKRVLRIHGNGDRIREVPIHPKLSSDLQIWRAERPNWPRASTNPALFLNRRGGRLSVRGARDVIARIAATAGLDGHTTAQVLRHTFAATLVGGGTDIIIVADMLGHARLESTRGYAKPTTEDRARALDLLPVDRSRDHQ